MAHPPGDGAGAECTVDEAIQFCERCGGDRDTFAGSRAAFRDCPACGSACCPDCWNLVDGACLACAPFRLRAETSRSRIVPVAGIDGFGTAAAPPAKAPGRADPPARAAAPTRAPDPYADLRDAPGTASTVDPFGRPIGPGILGTWEATRSTTRQRPCEAPAAGAAPALVAPDAWRSAIAVADPLSPRRRRRRSGRAAVAAVASWVFVAALAVAALGANPGATAVAKPTPAPATPGLLPTTLPTPAPAKPTAKPKPKPQKPPRAAPKPGRRDVAVPPAATGKPGPKATPRPTKPEVVTPPPVTPTPPPETPEPPAP